MPPRWRANYHDDEILPARETAAPAGTLVGKVEIGRAQTARDHCAALSHSLRHWRQTLGDGAAIGCRPLDLSDPFNVGNSCAGS
jgi:hypothetical protein